MGPFGDIRTDIDISLDLTLKTVTGKISMDDIITSAKEYLSQLPTSKIIWDFRNADVSSIKNEDFKKLLQMLEEFQTTPQDRKVALVVSSDLGFGLSRITEAYVARSKTNAEYQIFRSIQNAMVWLDIKGALFENSGER